MEHRDAEIAQRGRGCGALFHAPFVSAFAPSATAFRRGLILPVVLMMLALLGLLAGTFAFQVNADCAATQALVERMQTRLAAEAGFHYVSLLLREELTDVDAWYDNEEKLRGVLVWSSEEGPSSFGPVDESTAEAEEEESYAPAYRFSIVGDDPADDQSQVRYGLTDESAKLDLNVATSGQLTRLLKQVVSEEVSVAELVDSLLDWRDADDSPQANGAESSYYRQLTVPYRCKNAAFETVEELLMVRGFTGQILYGEDADRNGLLSANEDDGEITFPPDDEDGKLNRGLYPYVTVYARDYNRANDNRPRVVLGGSGGDSVKRLEEYFEPEEIAHLIGRTSGDGVSSLSALLDSASTNGAPSPFSLEDFPRIVDRCTLKPSPELRGLININTAPPIVLRSLEGLTEEDVSAIMQKRSVLSSEAKATTAWLLTQGVLEREKYDAVEGTITARGLQFSLETIGYSDHLGARTRLQIVFAMRGPSPQIVYYRDLTNLGVNYPLRRVEEEEWSQASDGPG
ncbi:MAG: general secretion pathway protein GspK [bacterium]|nr:general secretion pathway protein GspK [bacterium]